MKQYTLKNNDILMAVNFVWKTKKKFSAPDNYIIIYGVTAARSVDNHYKTGDTFNILGSHEGFHLVQYPMEQFNYIQGMPESEIYLVAYDFTKPGPMFLYFMMTFDDGEPSSPSLGEGTDDDTLDSFLDKSQQYFEHNPKLVDMLVRPFVINAKDP